jgi:tetratricopeptide (TPR) repeat protein
MSDEHILLDKHLADGNLDQAEALARNILGRDPDDVVAKVAMARLLAAIGRLAQAEAELRQLAADNPHYPEPLAYLAVLRQQAGDTAEALALAQQCLALGGEVAAALAIVADEKLEQGFPDIALNLYRRATQQAPSHSGAWLGIGRILAFRGDLADAEEAYIEAVQHGPQRVEAWLELIALEREGGAVEVAAENLTIALRLHPGHPALIALAREQEQEGEAQDPVRRAIQAIRSMLLEKDFGGAKAALAELDDHYAGDPRLLLARADVVAMTGKGDATGLIHTLMRAIRDEPHAWEPKVAVGRLLLLQTPLQNPKLAAAHCEDAWHMSGQHPFAGLALVEAWAALGRVAHARAVCERLVEGDGPEAVVARNILAGNI